MTGALALAVSPHCAGIEEKFLEQRQEFLSFYPNRAHHIIKVPNDPKWKTCHVWLFTGLIDAAISGECDRFYGAYWGEQTKFAVLDIDQGSKYHNAQELQRLRENLATIELSANVLFQSSESGGWHLYVPFIDPAPSKEVEKTLKAWLKAIGYEIIGGQLEVFPSGNALRLPLQRDFAWLDDNADVMLKREDLELDAALSRFLFDIKNNCNDWVFAKSQIESQLLALPAAAGGDDQARRERLEMGGFDDLFSGGKIPENWEKGRKFWQEGLSSAGQRHDAVLFIGHYLWYGDQENGIAPLPGVRNDEYRAKLIEDWLSKKHNGFCRHLDENKWETIRAQIKRAVLWRADGEAKDYEPYRVTDHLLKKLLAAYRKTGKVWTVEEWKKANEKRRDKARCKIRAAVEQCLTEGRQISRKTLEHLTGCSPNTVRKHGDLWRLFAAGSRQYNPGGGGGSSVLASDRFEEKKEKEFLDLSCSADSGGFCSVDASCSEELAPIVLTSPFLLPGSKPSSEPPTSIGLRSLNGFLPSSAEPTPGPLHLPLRPIDAGSLVRCYSGRTADGAGDLEPEPSCKIRAVTFGIMSDRRGNGDARQVISPANLVVFRRAKNTYEAVRQDKRRTAYAPGPKQHRSFGALPAFRTSTDSRCRCRYGSYWLGLSTLPRAPPNHRPEPRTFRI